MWLRKWQMLLWELPLGLFALSDLYYNSEHFFILAKSLYSLFSWVSQNSSVVFYVFILVLNFSKALAFCGTIFAISVRSLIIFTPISSFCLVLELSFSGQSHHLHPLIPCWCKILVRFTVIIGMKTDPVIIFMFWLIIWPFWTFFPLVSLSSREINLNILFFLSLLCLFLKLTFWFWWRFRASSLIIRLSTVPKPLPFRLASGRTFFYYLTWT